MKSRDRDTQRAVESTLSNAGIQGEWDCLGSKHNKLRFTVEGTSRFLTLPRSASDHRSSLNAVAQLRRLLRSTMGKQPEVTKCAAHGPKRRKTRRLGMTRAEKRRLASEHAGASYASVADGGGPWAKLQPLRQRLSPPPAPPAGRPPLLRLAVELRHGGRLYVASLADGVIRLDASLQQAECFRDQAALAAAFLSLKAASPDGRILVCFCALANGSPGGAHPAPGSK
jgi:hypothetical protein